MREVFSLLRDPFFKGYVVAGEKDFDIQELYVGVNLYIHAIKQLNSRQNDHRRLKFAIEYRKNLQTCVRDVCNNYPQESEFIIDNVVNTINRHSPITRLPDGLREQVEIKTQDLIES